MTVIQYGASQGTGWLAGLSDKNLELLKKIPSSNTLKAHEPVRIKLIKVIDVQEDLFLQTDNYLAHYLIPPFCL